MKLSNYEYLHFQKFLVAMHSDILVKLTRKLYQTSHVFSPISAHFYPPLYHNGKGYIPSLEGLSLTLVVKVTVTGSLQPGGDLVNCSGA